MNREIERQGKLIERSGMGLLPGLALAFAIVLIAMLALTSVAWWITFGVLAVLIGVTAAIAFVVVKLIDVDGGDDHSPAA
jgi:uncharacterized membrane protein YdbT with pleckstrin-like domain